MGNLTCRNCGTIWDGFLHPACPKCLVDKYVRDSGFLREKHDPRYLQFPQTEFRSVMPNEYVMDSASYICHVVFNGTAILNKSHGWNYNYVVGVASWMVAGSAIYAESTTTEFSYDGLIVADAYGFPHIYPESHGKIQNKISIGSFLPAPICNEPSCGNLAVPGQQRCARHLYPAVAE